ncbi:MAG: hypothetical protein AB7Q17_01385 [Phycisphaerae bacterium]
MSPAPPAVPGRRIRRRALLLVAGGLAAFVAIGLPAAVLWRPTWYRPPSVDFSRLKEDERDLVAMLESVGARLANDASVLLEIDVAQANRWIAARELLWPEAHQPDLGPIRNPYVAISAADRLRVGAVASYGGWRAVISTDWHVELTGENIRLRCEAVRIGALPVGGAAWLGTVAEFAQEALPRLSVDPNGVVVMPLDWEWPNGKRRFRVSELALAPGRVVLRLAPRR